MSLSQRKGIALIAAIMLIVFATIVVFGVVTFVSSRLRQQPTEEIFLKTIYLAQAGLHYALYNFRYHDIAANGYFTLGQTNIDADNFFSLSANAAGLLMVNASLSSLTNGNRRVSNWTIQNATNSNTITIASMIVSWSGVVSSRRLSSIYLNNTSVWSGTGTSGSTFNITDFTLNTTPTLYSNNSLRFNDSMSGATVTVSFNMTDGSSETLVLYPASSNNNFTISSLGRTVGSTVNRSIQATYNALTGSITSYREI